jgi:hypothetical protein
MTVWKVCDRSATLRAAMSREEQIKELCARAVAAEGTDFESALRDLHAALKAHIDGLRAMTAAALLAPPTPSAQNPPTDLPQA